MRLRLSAATLRRFGCAALLAGAGAAFAASGVDSCPIPQGAGAGEKPEEEQKETADSRRDQEAWDSDDARALAGTSTLDTTQVAGILAAIEAPKPEVSWWERFMRELNAWLARSASEAAAPKWLVEALQAIPPWVFKLVFWLVFAALLGGLAAIAFIELRAAGVWRRKPKHDVERGAAASVPFAAPDLPDLAAIAALPLRARPAALLQWAIAGLVARQVLPADRSLTNGELLTFVRARAPGELPVFRRLARSAEAVVYGARMPDERETRELLESVSGPAAASS